jgi:1,4-dihydroxy-2-naphthoate octaprenyltransferase
MSTVGGVKPYLEIIRYEFLVFTFVVVSVPAALSLVAGEFDPVNTATATLLVLFAHIGVSALNVASDYRRGVDEDTDPTPFSGGVTTLTSGRASYATARNIGVAAVAVAVALTLWFARLYDAVEVAVLVVPGLLTAVAYTDVFTRTGLGELSCGIGLGAIPTLVVFYAQSGALNSEALLLSVPMFLVCFDLLLLNEFPDIEADTKNGRTNIPIVLGRQYAGYLYLVVAVATALSLVALVVVYDLPALILLGLVPTALLTGIFRTFLAGEPRITETDLLYHTLWAILTPVLVSAGLVVQWLTV